MDQVFKKVETVLKSQELVRTRLREHREKADIELRSVLQTVHKIYSAEDLLASTKAAAEELRGTGESLKAIENALPEDPGAYERYGDLWYSQTQMGVMIAVLIGFLLEDSLIGVEKVTEMVGADIRIQMNDYLIGICQAVQELARLSMNRVIVGDYVTAKRCARFGNDVFGGLKQLNLRNDIVRKKYDGLKYDIKKLDEIVYDLSIRGLLKDDTAIVEKDEEASADEKNVASGSAEVNGK